MLGLADAHELDERFLMAGGLDGVVLERHDAGDVRRRPEGRERAA